MFAPGNVSPLESKTVPVIFFCINKELLFSSNLIALEIKKLLFSLESPFIEFLEISVAETGNAKLSSEIPAN